jgi:hypothetical protein
LFLYIAIILSAVNVSGAFAREQAERLPVTVRKYDSVSGKYITERMVLNPSKTAIIVVDMWNYRWCMTASERVSAMVPRMNGVLAVARETGMQVVWNPSDVATAYSDYPQYENAVAVKHGESSPDAIRGKNPCPATN